MNPAKGGLSVSDFRLRYVGLGFLWAWIYCTWFSPAVFGGASGLTVNNDGTWIVSVLFVSLSLLISPFLFKRDLASTPWVLYMAPLATSVGAIAMSHQAMFAFSVPALSFVGAAATGICSGWLWIMWGEFFCSVDLEVTYIALPLTVAVPLCCILLTLGIRGAIAGVLVCLLPLLSGVCLFLCFRDREIICPVDTLPYPSSTTCILFLKQGIASLFIYACISFCWSLISYEAVGGWTAAIVLAYLVGGIAAIVTSCLSTMFSTKRDVFGMYRWLVPVTSFAFAFLSFGSSTACAIAFCLITVVQFGFDIVVWIYFTGNARKGICPGRFAAGVNRGFVQIGVLFGSVLGMRSADLSWLVGMDDSAIILLLLGCMTASVLMFFFREGSEREVGELRGEHDDAVRDGGTREDNACASFAECYSLTNRELDVLVLLATGRSVPYISEALFVSKNTVESHVKAIYKKAGVHSRQELLTRLHDIAENKDVFPE